MGFKLKEFSKAKFEARTATVSVPALAEFFDEGEKAEFVVRGLTGEETARVNEAQSKSKNLQAVVAALAGKDQTEKIQALQESLGLSADTIPGDLARRIEMLAMGCADPVIDVQTAAKIFKVAPVDGYNLTNEILRLSGQGMTVGKPKASGETKASKAPSTSDTPEAK